MQKVKLFIILNLIVTGICAQVYKDKKTRHRFAQLTIGYDYISSFGGQSSYESSSGLSPFNLNGSRSQGLVLGGTHFWGHADIYFVVRSFGSSGGVNSTEDFVSSHFSGFETVLKYYPLQIEHNKIRPFIGTGIVPYSFRQTNRSLEFGRGETARRYRNPLICGITYNYKNHLINVTGFFNYANQIDYHISREQTTSVKMPPFYLSLGYKYSIDASLSLEKGWSKGETQKRTEELRAKKRLNGIFIGVGLTTGYGLGESSYNLEDRPYLKDSFDSSFAADLSLGYFFSKPELSINFNWRKYRGSISAYGTNQNTRRNSFAIEMSHGFLDYHGFVPFIGPVLSYEILRGFEIHEGNRTFDITKTKATVGLLFGWDIKLTHMEWWHLRTNLRYFPFLNLEVENGKNLSFRNLEFNFIQAIIYPGRMFLKKRKAI